jgi:LmbE family N-acetylglucosaminyl deacetylase
MLCILLINKFQIELIIFFGVGGPKPRPQFCIAKKTGFMTNTHNTKRSVTQLETRVRKLITVVQTVDYAHPVHRSFHSLALHLVELVGEQSAQAAIPSSPRR